MNQLDEDDLIKLETKNCIYYMQPEDAFSVHEQLRDIFSGMDDPPMTQVSSALKEIPSVVGFSVTYEIELQGWLVSVFTDGEYIAKSFGVSDHVRSYNERVDLSELQITEALSECDYADLWIDDMSVECAKKQAKKGHHFEIFRN